MPGGGNAGRAEGVQPTSREGTRTIDDTLETASDNAAYAAFETIPKSILEGMDPSERFAVIVAINDAILNVLRDIVN